MSIQEDKIMNLMDSFDGIKSSLHQVRTIEDVQRWSPATESESRAFAELTLPENRTALREWYASATAVNPHAELFRQILARAIAEELPLKGG
jgi:hypothetical protein